MKDPNVPVLLDRVVPPLDRLRMRWPMRVSMYVRNTPPVGHEHHVVGAIGAAAAPVRLPEKAMLDPDVRFLELPEHLLREVADFIEVWGEEAERVVAFGAEEEDADLIGAGGHGRAVGSVLAG